MFRDKILPFLAVAAMLGGCYDYPAPPVATLGESYTQRERDAADELFNELHSLSLADAQRIALHNNPTYIAAHHSVAAAHMRYLQSFAGYMPQITASAGLGGGNSWVVSGNGRQYSKVSHPRSDSLNGNFSVSAQLLLFDGLIREFQVMEASSSEKYYAHLDADACRTMMLAVAQAYNSVLLAIENRRIAEEDRNFQMTSLRDTKYKFEAGAVPLSDVLNFEILMDNAEVALIKADYQYESSLYALALLMGYPDGTFPKEVTFSGHIKTNFVDLPAVEVYLDAALANRPDLKGYREQLEIAKYQLYQQYGSFSPTASAYFSWGYSADGSYRNDDNNQFGPGSSRSFSENSNIAYGLNADWVIFSGFRRYNKVREYEANLAVANYRTAAQWFQVVNDVRTAYAAYMQSVRQTKMVQKVRDLSAKQRDLVDDEYRAGNTELTRLNEAQRDFVDAEANLASSYINIQNARAALDSAVGVNNADFYENQPSAEAPEADNPETKPVTENPPDADVSVPAAAPAPAEAAPQPQTPETTDAAPVAAQEMKVPAEEVTQPQASETTGAVPAVTQETAAPAAPEAEKKKSEIPVIPASATALP
ncbi:MAG: TolC family protein [Victivallaceae bacterium]|nr:TolC family protein [Victivallaceae bacterium]